LGILRIGFQPQGLVVTPSGAFGLVAYPVPESRIVEKRRLSVVGEALVDAAGDRRGELIVQARNAMYDGMGELVCWPGKNAPT
jgi:hypothetical protein